MTVEVKQLGKVGMCITCRMPAFGSDPRTMQCEACFVKDRDAAYLDLAIQDYIWSAEELYRDLEY